MHNDNHQEKFTLNNISCQDFQVPIIANILIITTNNKQQQQLLSRKYQSLIKQSVFHFCMKYSKLVRRRTINTHHFLCATGQCIMYTKHYTYICIRAASISTGTQLATSGTIRTTLTTRTWDISQCWRHLQYSTLAVARETHWHCSNRLMFQHEANTDHKE